MQRSLGQTLRSSCGSSLQAACACAESSTCATLVMRWGPGEFRARKSGNGATGRDWSYRYTTPDIHAFLPLPDLSPPEQEEVRSLPSAALRVGGQERDRGADRDAAVVSFLSLPCRSFSSPCAMADFLTYLPPLVNSTLFYHYSPAPIGTRSSFRCPSHPSLCRINHPLRPPSLLSSLAPPRPFSLLSLDPPLPSLVLPSSFYLSSRPSSFAERRPAVFDNSDGRTIMQGTVHAHST
ncbi:hypothetical protein MVEN_01965900 [Mycena venus]|uniref:Uncharacterized protein n=1 Tax=Mycena venus TaxID=2733690 RepID=A0A8H6XG58_9AGAR|nr:hypothetical protein MVEN_01965900 [Mycena venus]